MKEEWNVLIVEDDLTWQKKFKRFLKNESFIISTATTYADALALIERQSFDLVILDVNLTGVVGNFDGLRLGNKLWSQDKNTKIIIVSGSEEANRRGASLIFQPRFILKKERLDPQDFLQKVHLALASPSLQG